MKRSWVWVLVWTLSTSVWAHEPQETMSTGADMSTGFTSLSDPYHQTPEDPVVHLLQSTGLTPRQPWQSSMPAPLNLSTPVGTTPTEVTPAKDLPEPATIALLGLGAVALCSGRHRWHRSHR